ncbi:DUF1540 domain-containing protein [Austwickia chelonae]|uniref:DUF1540 domain-containing protein n=1 Tax=Austwickia chelonae TaxID=100225 RepID=UPI000E23F5B0|nr:DUF1540 domain-containing protein [Austwickia chelonae]
MSALATVSSCSTTSCSYNRSGCTAFAITVGGPSGGASCSTFIALDARGGGQSTDSRVGACQRLDCTHNTDLMCTADGIEVGGESARCESYSAR